MTDPNRALLERAVVLLEPMLDELVLVGGCVTGLLITDDAAGGIRPTKDIDAIVDVASYADYADLSERLRARALVEDHDEGAPLCRWRYEDLIVDVMPTAERILGFSNCWYIPAIRSAQTLVIADRAVRVVTPVHFVATKLAAFQGRGHGDFASHDLEDIIMVVDGRQELVGEIGSADLDVRSYIGSEIGALLANRLFVESLAGLLLPDAGSQARRSLVESRLRTLASIGSG